MARLNLDEDFNSQSTKKEESVQKITDVTNNQMIIDQFIRV